jgi:hypothetical protein
VTSQESVVVDPLRKPVRETKPSREVPWRDNAWLAFWDRAADVIGVAHVSTSPNAGARHARISVSHESRLIEIIEPLAAGTFAGARVSFDLDDGIDLRAPEVGGTLSIDPLFAVADYTRGAVFPSLPGERPLNHYQQAAHVTGHLVLGGESIDIDGHGFRDRTWGYRNESATILEYIATQCVFPTFSVSAMRFHVAADDSDRAEGFVLAEHSQRMRPFTEVIRGRAGEVLEFRLESDGGDDLVIAVAERLGGFPVPVSPERNSGPTLAAFEEFCVVRASDGSVGFGVLGVGSRRQLC